MRTPGKLSSGLSTKLLVDCLLECRSAIGYNSCQAPSRCWYSRHWSLALGMVTASP